jgi:NOL1/NOP2/sun family putative RNA methylase
MRPTAEFRRYHQRLFGGEYQRFMGYIQRRVSRHSIRINTLKSGRREVERVLRSRNIEYGQVPWCVDGLWVSDNRLDFLEHQLGLFYVQSADSMVPVVALDPQPGETVLDLCAAPGGKTTHIAQLMENKGTLIANDNNTSRIRGLVYSIQKCGVSNAIVTHYDGVRLVKEGLKFDRILVDAPCSDVGTARKNPQIFKKWGMDWVSSLAVLQKKLASAAYRMLKPGGVMVYSTCTTTIEENEDVVDYILHEYESAGLVEVRMEGLEHSPGFTGKTKECVRVLPQHNNTGCFFTAKVVKNE